MFHLENEIKKWRKNLERESGLEPGHIEELESHLRDKIESIQDEGYSEKKAFEKAILAISDTEELADEFTRARTIPIAHPDWKARYLFTALLPNFLKTSVRSFWRRKAISTINIAGLAVGISCCLLIGLYVNNEWSYDTFHSKSDRIYRVWVKETLDDGRILKNTATPVPLGPAIRGSIPEIENHTYLYSFNNLVKTEGSANALSEQIRVSGEDFFHIFDFPLIRGDTSSVFDHPSSVVITPETAKRYFGENDPINRTLSIRLGSEFRDFKVTGIIAEAPPNSSLQYRMIIPDTNLEHLIGERLRQSWGVIFGSTYVLLRQGTDPGALKDKFSEVIRTRVGEDATDQYTINLQPITDIHLNTGLPGNIATVSDPMYSYILAVIALFILLIACVNFMTLSISKSAYRAREVGIRKTVGAIRKHLVYQFWGESLLITLLALLFGFVLAKLFLPYFNELSGTALEMIFTGELIAVMLVSAVIISLVAGIYPALILSGFKPIEVLKGRLNLSADKSFFRQAMVVTQFAISIGLIIGALIVKNQLNFVQNKNLGYQKEQIVVIESGFTPGPQLSREKVAEKAIQRKQILKNKLSGFAEIEAIAFSNFTPVQMSGWFRLGFLDDNNQQHNFHGNIVDADFLPTLGIKVIEGRNFSDNNPSDPRRAFIINQAMADHFGWDNPIGQRLPGPEFNDHEIIGVIENFHFESLHTPIEPLALTMTPALLFSGINNMSLNNSSAPRYSLKITTDDLPATMNSLKETWNQVAPGTPFDFTFVDQALDSQYREEQRLGKIVTAGTVFAIVIACLGLFGLASLMVIRRSKEIGVRKVLGASTSSIILLINKEFTKLVVIAFAISAPVAWYVMNQWLQNFAYRIDLGIKIFLISGLFALVVAWITVSYQSIKAILIDPVNTLRSE